ncbi:G-protein coupled receptor 1 [Tanacetum coccineum]
MVGSRWLKLNIYRLSVHFSTFYAPLWGAILFNGIVYFQVIRMLNNVTRMAVGMSDRGSQSDTRADMKELYKELERKQALNRWGYYPLILIGAWSFGTVNRIHDFIEPGHKIFWLSVLDVGMSALMGLFNSIAYGLNSSVRWAIFERLDLLPESIRRWFPKKLKSRSQQAQHESELVSLRIDEKH